MVKILIVEDEMMTGAKISMYLSELTYEITGILPRGEEVLDHIKRDRPDLIVLDIHLKGKMDGIQTAETVERHYNIPIIYLTANADEATFNRAKLTKPVAFITKPFKKIDLQRTIELAIGRTAEHDNGSITFAHKGKNEPFILSDRIFVRHKEKMVKIMIADILYIEAERNYSRIFTLTKEYLLCVTLKTIEEKFPGQLFRRIHRSYFINLQHVEAVADDYVLIAQKMIPLSENLKMNLMQHIQRL